MYASHGYVILGTNNSNKSNKGGDFNHHGHHTLDYPIAVDNMNIIFIQFVSCSAMFDSLFFCNQGFYTHWHTQNPLSLLLSIPKL